MHTRPALLRQPVIGRALLRHTRLCLLLLVPFLFTACATPGDTPSAAELEQAPPAVTPIDGTRWELAQLAGHWLMMADTRNTPWIRFDGAERRVQGFDGCNRFHGDLRLAGNRLKIGPLGATRRACPPSLAPEAAFQEALSIASRWRNKGSELELLDERDNSVALLRAGKP